MIMRHLAEQMVRDMGVCDVVEQDVEEGAVGTVDCCEGAEGEGPGWGAVVRDGGVCVLTTSEARSESLLARSDGRRPGSKDSLGGK
jgi:hypothetical protein